jgi:sterol desaturase/sphingolipid hydroxylase (fatty acid hydroxylase superfamily)
MFKSGWMELLSKVHFTVPLYIYIPVIAYLTYLSISAGTVIAYLGFLVLGFAVWTAAEYLLHRYIFHFVPKSKWGLRLHFIFHGVHHDYPKDRMRLVMPPSASIPMALILYFFFSLFFSVQTNLFAFFAGFLIGYLIYDMLHYAMHHYNFKSGLMKKIKQHHMLHHYSDPAKGYGVSSALWDKIFRSDFEKEKA